MREVPFAAIVALGLAGGAAVVVSGVADQRERVLHLRLHCSESACSASVGGGAPLHLNVPGEPAGNALGLYSFAPWESRSEQCFRNLSVQPAPSAAARSYSLTGADVPPGLGPPDWRVSAAGTCHTGRAGDRAVALVGEDAAGGFELAVDLVDAADIGVAFGARDGGNAHVVAVRPRFNDVLFFDLVQGQPGPVHDIGPLRELSVGREALRLAGLVGRLVLAASALIALALAASLVLPRSAPPAASAAQPRPPAWIAPALAAATFAALASVAAFGFEQVPHLDDEAAYLFQAKIFAAGMLWAPAPPAPEFFLHEHVVVDGARWFAKYPPLYPALLALGVLARAPWLVNPVLGALVGLALFGLLRELMEDWRWAAGGWLLLLTSPFFLVMGGTMMSHMTCALFVTLCLWQTLVALRYGKLGRAVVAGLCLGLASLARPFTALLIAVAVGIYGLAAAVRAEGRWRAVAIVATIAVAASPFAAGLVAWSSAYAGTGVTAVELYTRYDSTDRLGFGADRGSTWLRTWGSWGHTPAKALRSVHQYLEYTSRHLLGWPAGLSLALALAGVVCARRPDDRWLLAGAFAALALGHMLYWATQHLAYGARYWFCAVPALLALSMLGLRELSRPSRATAGLVAVFVLWNFTSYLPDRLRELPAYAGIKADLRREIDRRRLDRAVVFVKTQGVLFNDGFFLNDPVALAGPVFARDLGERNAELLAELPGRLPYRWDGQRLERLRR